METKILRVVRQGEAFGVQSAKAEGGSIQKCNIVLRELGGSKFENEFVCAMLGNLAACKFYEGDVVAATLRFSTHEYQGQTFQEIGGFSRVNGQGIRNFFSLNQLKQ